MVYSFLFSKILFTIQILNIYLKIITFTKNQGFSFTKKLVHNFDKLFKQCFEKLPATMDSIKLKENSSEDSA
jgi:hypothetical protein